MKGVLSLAKDKDKDILFTLEGGVRRADARGDYIQNATLGV